MPQPVHLSLQGRDRTFKRGDAPIMVIARRGHCRGGTLGWRNRLFWCWGKQLGEAHFAGTRNTGQLDNQRLPLSGCEQLQGRLHVSQGRERRHALCSASKLPCSLRASQEELTEERPLLG